MNKLKVIVIFFSFYLLLFQTAWVTTPIEATSIGTKSSSHFNVLDNDQTCTPGEGTMWVTGPLDEQKAIEIQNALNMQGILANVEARGYGEMDSCGTYFQKGFDFKVTLATNNKATISPDAFQNNLDDIQSIVETNAGENPGNIVILDSAGKRLNSQPLQAAEIQTLDDNPPSASVITKNVYVIVYNPVLANGQTLSQYMHWNDPSTITQQTIDFFQQVSNGKLIYTIAYTSMVTSGWPELIDGYTYNETTYFQVIGNPNLRHIPTEVNYTKIIDDPAFDICGKVNRGEIDEVWIYNGPWFGFYESRLVGPNAYTFNSPPVNNSNCSEMVPVMGPSMERTTHEAVHNFTHRAEATMTKVYGGWAQNRTNHNWDKFGLVKAQSPNYSYSGCGSSHYPPNGVQDYDYANSTSTLSNCEDFLNFPGLSDPLQVGQPVNCYAWGCNGLGYYDYWFSHFPSADGCTDYIANDWWKYFAEPSNALVPAKLCDAWIISGNAGVGGATLNYNDDKARTVKADNLGNYSLPVPYGWSGSITPLRTSYTFSPLSLSFTNLTSDVNGQNFVATWGCPTITDWKGEYWGNTTMSGAPILCRNDASINFPWGGGSPDPIISADYFSARWTRTLYFASGLYRFRMSHDDGARLYIDDVIKIDVMGTCCVWDQVDIPLSGSHSIRMEMFENNGGAGAQLEILTLSLYQPEIQVLGNNVSILDGDSSASTTDHTNFGNVNTSESTLARTFTIQNTGMLDLVLNGNPKVEISGTNSSDFTITVQPSSPLLPSGSTTFTVLFDPSASGVRTATITIANDDSNENPYNFVIQGTGVALPEIDIKGNNTSILNGDVTPSSLDFTDFGNAELTSNIVSRTFTIHNIGDSNLILTGSPNKISISGANSSDFTISTSPLSPITPGSTSTFTITFTPSSIGIRTAVLSISNNDANESPFTFSIQGVGVDTTNTYIVTFDANGGSSPVPMSKQVTLDSTYGALATTSRTGYTFEGWFTEASGGTQVATSTVVSNASNHTLYAQWTPLPNHTVNFNSNGGSGSMTSQVSNVPAILTSNTFTRAGYSFAGWNTSFNGSGIAYADGTNFNFSTDITLYAQWTANNYTLTFNTNRGNAPIPASKQVTFGSTYGTLATTSRLGYTFAGWFTAVSGGTQVTTSTVVSNASNHTLYAQWTANNYTVLFDSNGGSPYFPASKVVVFGSTYGTLATASRMGYTFAGWFTAANGGTQVTPSTLVSNASNHTLYAQWTALPNHTVIFDANGGTGSMSNQVANDLTPLTVNAFTRSGYTFTGWNTVANGSGSSYADNAPYSFDANITLYAQWTVGTANVDITIGGVNRGTYGIAPGSSQRVNYAGLDAGPVVVDATNDVPIIAALRDAYFVNGKVESFVQLMGLPEAALSTKYYFPAYNNVTLDGQLRFGNVGSSNTTVTVTIAGVVRGTYNLAPGQAQRVNYTGLDAGPVIVESSGGVPIIAALRDAYFVNGQIESFAQLMGLPASQLSDTYYFPAYNNVTLDGQLRIGNVDTVPTTVTVTIAGVLRGTYPLNPNEAVRINYAGLDAGPVVVQSSGGAKIIAALRDAYFVNGQVTSFVQLMGLPLGQLSTKYYFPAYNNVTLDGQLRFGNVGNSNTTVTVTIAGVVRGTYNLAPGQAQRVNYAGLDAGPVIVESSGGVPIIAALRDAYFVNGVLESFAQLMGLPDAALSPTYYFPAYNNVTLDGQLRFGVP